MQTHRRQDGHNAVCLKSKAELPFNGGLAFILGKGGKDEKIGAIDGYSIPIKFFGHGF